MSASRGDAPLRVAILRDLREEGWPSMDRVADALLDALRREHRDAVEVVEVSPTLRRRFTTEGVAAGPRFNADRLLGRMWDYPRVARRAIAGRMDVYHVVDHSYSHLVHALPPGRTVVTCHDLDTFRSVIDPQRDPRGVLFRRMVSRILGGLQSAAHVTCVSATVRDELLSFGLLDPARVSVVHNGVDPVCSPAPNVQADREAATLLGPVVPGAPLLVHVGSCIARKRIDVLLHVLHRVAAVHADVRLIRVGGDLSGPQRQLARQLGVDTRVVTMPFVSREVLAAIYRRATLVLQPSSAEGFGLPVIEALACGAPVVASDLPVLREVGGPACTYCPVGDIDAWAQAVTTLLAQPADTRGPSPEARRAQAAHFSWSSHGRHMLAIYEELRAH